MTSELILVACAANVCRSPMAELLLRRGLSGMPDIRVASAGSAARAGGEICPLVAEWGGDDSWAAEAVSHRARRAAPELLRAAALILVSSHDVRAALVLQAPEVRGRTFTLREAAHLGEEFNAGTRPSHAGHILRYTAHLDRARVVRGGIPSGRGRWGRARWTVGPDIVDGHGRSRRAHRAALDGAFDATNAIIGQLGGTPVAP